MQISDLLIEWFNYMSGPIYFVIIIVIVFILIKAVREQKKMGTSNMKKSEEFMAKNESRQKEVVGLLKEIRDSLKK
jgi:large-conductance mechanosensitive channel